VLEVPADIAMPHSHRAGAAWPLPCAGHLRAPASAGPAGPAAAPVTETKHT
jgi:hypothetical protein